MRGHVLATPSHSSCFFHSSECTLLCHVLSQVLPKNHVDATRFPSEELFTTYRLRLELQLGKVKLFERMLQLQSAYYVDYDWQLLRSFTGS